MEQSEKAKKYRNKYFNKMGLDYPSDPMRFSGRPLLGSHIDC